MLKRVLIVVVLLAPGALVGPASAYAEPERPSYDLALRYDGRNHSLSGSQKITFVNSGSKVLRDVWLRVWANGPRGCRTRGVSVRVAAGGRAAGWMSSCTALRVRLFQPVRSKTRGSIRLTLKLKAPKRSGERFALVQRAAYFTTALPLLAAYERDRPLLSPWSGDRAESFNSVVSQWRTRVVTSTGTQVVMTGAGAQRRRGKTTEFVSHAFARDFAVVAGPFRSVTGRNGSTLVRFWRLPGTDPRFAERAVRHAIIALKVFERWGAYPGRELDLVDSKLGMEYPELVLTGTDPATLTHEIAHQWFYGLVGNDQYAHPWLDESLSTYAGLLAMRAIELPDLPEERRSDGGCSSPSAGEAGRSMAYWRSRMGKYGPVVYQQGQCALVKLELGLGKRQFDDALRTYVSEHRFGVAAPDDFRAALLVRASSQALSRYAAAFGG